MIRRRWVKRLALILGGLFCLYLAAGQIIGPWAVRSYIKNQPAGRVAIDSVRSVWPLGVTIENLRVADPVGKLEFLIKVPRATFRIPWWGGLVRPIPVQITLESPHMKVSAENVTHLAGGMKVRSQEWFAMPFEGMETEEKPGEPERPTFFLPIGIRATNGRVDVIDESMREGQPVFVADRVQLSLGLTAVTGNPTVRLTSRGDFVTREGKPIGFLDVWIEARPTSRSMQGRMRFRHEQLGDFYNLYQYAPRQVWIEGGIADFRMEFTLTNGSQVDFTAGCLVQNLDLKGQVEGGVSWADIMHAVEDEERKYEWEVRIAGTLGDPAFDPHDYVLSVVELDMKERAAARGIRVPGQMFFYADTPEAE